MKKTTAPFLGAPCLYYVPRWLRELDDVLRRRALLALHDFELDALAFGERLEALRLNCGVMHEAVLFAVFRRDETEPLRVVEPLHGTGDTCHLMKLLFTNCSRRRASSPCGAPRTVIPAPVSEAINTKDLRRCPRSSIGHWLVRSALLSPYGHRKSSV